MINQIPAPPIDMVMPALANQAYNLVAYSILAIVALLLAREARQRQSMLPLLCLLGGAIACLLEPAFDILCLVWYPQVDHKPLFRGFNYSIPFWMLPAYALYMGAQGYWMYRQFSPSLSVPRLWRLFFLFWCSNLALELPGLNLGIYTYYGAQPFTVFGFPAWMAMTNALIPILVGAALYGLRKVLLGWRVVLVVPLLPMIVAAGEAAAGWPVWLALNSGLGLTASYCAALLTLVLSLTTVYLLSITACAASTAPAASDRSFSAAMRPRSAS